MRNARLVVASLLAALALVGSAARAEFMAVKTHEVPVARLIANLERQLGKDAEKAIAADPGKASIAFELARLHALAWSTARATVTVDDRRDAPWWGYLPPEVPWAGRLDRQAKRTPAIEAHLEAAIRLYRLGLAVAPNDAVELGLAWCLAQQSGEARAEGVKRLRAIGDRAWATEKDKQQWGMGDFGIAWEAARYLVDLLDAQADAAEIAALRARIEKVESFPRPITPIVVPLIDDVGLDAVVDARADVRFDLDGTRSGRGFGWVVPGRGAWLVWDPSGAGAIASGLELFGSVTFWVFWRDGYAALAALDDDGDGALRGGELDGLALWSDDGDGVAEAGEVRPVAAIGIVALDVRADRHGDTPWCARGATFADGRVRPTWDFIAR
ncbi:MAG: hypothetical protein U1F43_15765 [Myxococcota bacterium]